MTTAKQTARHSIAYSRGVERGDFRCVAIVMPEDCCEAAQALRDKRFLLTEAPALPLAGCARPWLCRCRLVQQSDRRRAQSRRRTDLSNGTGWRGGSDRRLGLGRRLEDWRSVR